MRQYPDVMTYTEWRFTFPNPTLAQLLLRYHFVTEAIKRCKEAGEVPNPKWFGEILGPEFGLAAWNHHIDLLDLGKVTS